MEIEDFAEPEIAITAAVAAAVFSPRARKVMRKGLVYGMAGVLAAGDAVTSFAQSVGQGVRQASAQTAQASQGADGQSGTTVQEAGEEKTPEGAAASSKRKNAPKTEPAKAADKAEGKPA
jgi:hypothetical protein